MKSFSLSILFSLVSLCYAGMVVQHTLPSVPSGFVSKGPAPAEDTIEIRLALASNNVKGLEDKLMSISTPGSTEFRQWLSMDEVTSLSLDIGIMTSYNTLRLNLSSNPLQKPSK